MLFVRVYARYLVPLTILSLIAFAPLLVVALRIAPPPDLAHARPMLRLAYVLAGISWIPLLVLVGGAAAAVDGGSQLSVLWAGIRQLGRAVVPCLFAAAAIVIGGVALVVPGLALVVLLSLTGASRARGVTAAVDESVARVRETVRVVIVVVAVTIAMGAAIVYLAQQIVVPMPLPRKPTATQLLAFPRFVWISIALLALSAPIPAVALAAIHRGRR